MDDRRSRLVSEFEILAADNTNNNLTIENIRHVFGLSDDDQTPLFYLAKHKECCWMAEFADDGIFIEVYIDKIKIILIARGINQKLVIPIKNDIDERKIIKRVIPLKSSSKWYKFIDNDEYYIVKINKSSYSISSLLKSSLSADDSATLMHVCEPIEATEFKVDKKDFLPATVKFNFTRSAKILPIDSLYDSKTLKNLYQDYDYQLKSHNSMSNIILIAIDRKWLDLIKSGIKIYEGRLWSEVESWDLFVGKYIGFFDKEDPEITIKVKITNLLNFSDFGKAFDQLSKKLIPDENINRDEVISLFNEYYDENQITKNGIVVIEMQVYK